MRSAVRARQPPYFRGALWQDRAPGERNTRVLPPFETPTRRAELHKRPHPSAVPAEGIPAAQLERPAQGWILDGGIRQHSRHTLEARRSLTRRLRWFLRDREAPSYGTHELRAFVAAVGRGERVRGQRAGAPA